jgi:hypothetical protein
MTRSLWKSWRRRVAPVSVPDARLLLWPTQATSDQQRITGLPGRVSGAPTFPQVMPVPKLLELLGLSIVTIFTRQKTRSLYYHHYILTLKD